MTKFDAKNTTKPLRRLASERAEYTLQAFPENNGMGPSQVTNFNFAERTLYGRVDRQHNPVIPKKEFIVPAMTPDGRPSAVLLMNFVAYQWRDLQLYYRKSTRMGLLNTDDPLLANLKAFRGYKDPLEDYRAYLEDLLYSYVFTFLETRTKQVISFDIFLQYLLQFMENMRDIFPITFTGWQRSRNSNIFSSGLAIDIGSVSFSDDTQKQSLLLSSPNFQYYMETALRFGFSINKRNPGVLVSDLESPQTAFYRDHYNMPNLESIFQTQYSKTIYSDIPELINMFIVAWNGYVATNPSRTTFESKQNVTFASRITLDNINNNTIHDNNILYNKIIKLYINIRNIEERKPYKDNDISRITDNALRIKNISENTMLEYIDDQFKAKYNLKDGSLTYHKKRILKKLDKPE